LQQKGFFISKRSTSNYTSTQFSIAASLNMSDLKYDKTVDDTAERNNELLKIIRENRLSAFLTNFNYKIYNLSLFDFSNSRKFYYLDGYFVKTNFLSRTLFDVIIVNTFERKILNTNMQIYNKLKTIPASSDTNPKFVYAHFMMPHYPYFFDKNGTFMPRGYSGSFTPITLSILEDKQKYLDQLIYTNKVTLDIIDCILNHSIKKPVIIIQGDHGFRAIKIKGVTTNEAHTILNAYYFPDLDYKLLNDSINPINSFRIILNKYFNTNLNYLPTPVR